MDARELPRPSRRLPLIGDLWRINPNGPIRSELALAESVGPLFEMNVGGSASVLIATDHKAIKSVNNEDEWCKFMPKPFVLMGDELTGRGLLTAKNKDDLWSKANEVLQPGFSQSAMRGYHPAMITAANELAELWAAAANDDELVDVPAAANRFTLEVIARAGFGTTFGALSPDYEHGFAEELTDVLSEASAASNSVPIASDIRKRRLRGKVKPVRAAAEDIVANPTGTTEDNLLARMCPASGAAPLPTDNIVDQCLTFLAAGNETTAGLIAFCLHYLAQNQDIQDEVAAEAAAAPDPANLEYDDVPRLRLTRRVVDETLRLWPVAPAYFRRARADCTIDSTQFGPVTVRKNTVVMPLLLGAHRDVDTWGADAGEWNPDRFKSANLRNHPDRIYRPFGVGPRSCIGRQFALHEAVLAVSTIVRRFIVRPEPGYTLRIAEQITLKPEGLKIHLEER